MAWGLCETPNVKVQIKLSSKVSGWGRLASQSGAASIQLLLPQRSMLRLKCIEKTGPAEQFVWSGTYRRTSGFTILCNHAALCCHFFTYFCRDLSHNQLTAFPASLFESLPRLSQMWVSWPLNRAIGSNNSNCTAVCCSLKIRELVFVVDSL